MTHKISSISDLPDTTAIYAMYGGRGQGLYVAYVGVAGNLRNRIRQHLVRRDSSVATGTSAAVLNPDYVTEVRWWEYPDFVERDILEAAEIVAFEVLNPALRSRGAISESVKTIQNDTTFQERMQALFRGEPAGHLIILTLQDALEKIETLERRVDELERMISGK